MLLLAAMLSLASPPSQLPLTGYATVSSATPGEHRITLFDQASRDTDVVSELSELVAGANSSERLSCKLSLGFNLCTVRLQGPEELLYSNSNIPEVGAWEMAFKGASAAELFSLLEGLDTSKGVPGYYVSSASGRIACEAAEQTCVIRNFQ